MEKAISINILKLPRKDYRMNHDEQTMKDDSAAKIDSYSAGACPALTGSYLPVVMSITKKQDRLLIMAW